MMMMFLYEARARARAHCTEASSAQLGTHFNIFLPNWDQEGQKPKKSHQSTKAAGPAQESGNTLGLLPQAMALALAMERRSMPPTLHHWTSVSPRGPLAPHSKTEPIYMRSGSKSQMARKDF